LETTQQQELAQKLVYDGIVAEGKSLVQSTPCNTGDVSWSTAVFAEIAGSLAFQGDIDGAVQLLGECKADPSMRIWDAEPWDAIAYAQHRKGDDESARKSIAMAMNDVPYNSPLAPNVVSYKTTVLVDIICLQSIMGDVAAAQKSFAQLAIIRPNPHVDKNQAGTCIASAQALSGDNEGAKSTAAALSNPDMTDEHNSRDGANYYIAIAQCQRGDLEEAKQSVARIVSPYVGSENMRTLAGRMVGGGCVVEKTPDKPAEAANVGQTITVDDWMNEVGSMQDRLYIDFPGYLQSQQSDNPGVTFDNFYRAAGQMIDKQREIARLLAKQGLKAD
jgi:hypothetical protein